MVEQVPRPSAWSKFPTEENPENRYKFTSLEINFSQDQLLIDRSTYSFLDWLGDVGGLLGALMSIGAFITKPISTFTLDAMLLTNVFMWRASQNEKFSSDKSQNESKNTL